jgi:photosystem II stability/assembly factor-like uncharacterized protein
VLDDGVQSVEFSTSDPELVYAGNPGFIYRSQDGGRTWSATRSESDFGWGAPGVEAGFPIDFQVDPRDPRRIFANNYGGGNFMSEDGGVNWVDASRGYTGAQVRSIAVSPGEPAQVYAAARSGIFGSSDGGGVWVGLNYPQASGLEWNAVAVDPEDPEHILAANNWHGGVYESRDRGQTWQLTDIPRFEMQGWRVITFAPSHPRIVYAGSGGFYSAGSFSPDIRASGIYKSQDGGSTWEAANDSLTEYSNITDLALHPEQPQVVYAASPRDGLFRSTDGGATWLRLEGLPPQARPRSIALHPIKEGTLFVGLDFGGLYRSTDAGESWQPITAGLPPESSIQSIKFNPGDPDQLYLADNMSGVYQSMDGGQTWSVINEGLRTRAVTALAFSSDGRHLYAATDGEGVYRLDLEGGPPEGAAAPDETGSMPTAETPEEPKAGLPCVGGFAPLAFVVAYLIRRK